MDLSAPEIIGFLENYGYIAAFVAMILSGPLGAIAAGFLAGRGFLNPIYVWLVSLTADITSDIFYYELGRRGGRRLLKRLESVFKWTSALEAKVEWLFNTHGRKTILLVKFTQGFGTITQVMAGIGRMPRRIFIIFNLAGGAVKSAILVTIGVLAGEAWRVWVQKVENIGWALTLFALIVVMLVLVVFSLQTKIFKNSGHHG